MGIPTEINHAVNRFLDEWCADVGTQQAITQLNMRLSGLSETWVARQNIPEAAQAVNQSLSGILTCSQLCCGLVCHRKHEWCARAEAKRLGWWVGGAPRLSIFWGPRDFSSLVVSYNTEIYHHTGIIPTGVYKAIVRAFHKSNHHTWGGVGCLVSLIPEPVQGCAL